jgi:hypothetical protein
MRIYRLCLAHRTTDGVLSPPLREKVITAEDATGAVAQAKSLEMDMTGLRANALYLVDENGHVAWSLRMADNSDGPV